MCTTNSSYEENNLQRMFFMANKSTIAKIPSRIVYCDWNFERFISKDIGKEMATYNFDDSSLIDHFGVNYHVTLRGNFVGDLHVHGIFGYATCEDGNGESVTKAFIQPCQFNIGWTKKGKWATSGFVSLCDDDLKFDLKDVVYSAFRTLNG